MKEEKQTFQEKEKYFKEKKELTQERINLIKVEIEKLRSVGADFLKINSLRLEALDLEASLEGIETYWNHYVERLKSLNEKEELLTKERVQNFANYCTIYFSVLSNDLKKYNAQFQKRYTDVYALLNKELQLDANQKNMLYAMVRDILMEMKKI